MATRIHYKGSKQTEDGTIAYVSFTEDREMKIPDNEFWYIAVDGPGAGNIWPMLDEIGVGYGFRSPEPGREGVYRNLNNEKENGLIKLYWVPDGQQG